MSSAIALCDANAFYCSCERVFNPGLRQMPLGVLSNNDGCIVARTSELKALGVAMGTPAFKVRDLVEQGAIVLKSSNYSLYGDMSARFMSVLEQFSSRVEIYSIDEAFVDLSAVAADERLSIGRAIQERVQQWTGLPIGVGIAGTRTLAKLANHAAKKYPATGGVVDLSDPDRQQRLMAITPVSDIWGVGRRIARALEKQGIHTAEDLVRCPRGWIRKQFSVVLERTVCELQGENALEPEDSAAINKHQIVCSRSFGQRVTRKEELHSALACFISRACEKLRQQNQFAREAVLFIRTDPFHQELAQDNQSIRIATPAPVNDTRPWLQQLSGALDRIYQEGHEYKKAGVMLMELCQPGNFQGDLLTPDQVPESQAMMEVLDTINQRFGRNTLRPASVGFTPGRWHMNQQYLSPCYTTRWPDIMVVYAR